MNMKKVLLTALAVGASEYPFSNPHNDVMWRNPKFQYAGLSKHSPSHAQQKRDSKKAKNKGRKV
jgi:hypothetical protein